MSYYFRVLITYQYKKSSKGKAHKALGVIAKDAEEAAKKVKQYLQADYFELNAEAKGQIHLIDRIGAIDIQ